jgi:glycosyltransferase involved in cell wall biosynthesis
MPSRRILIFSTAYYPFIGGAEVAVKEITDRLAGDFEFDLITARMDATLPRSEKIGGVTVHRLGSGNPRWDKLLLPVRGTMHAWKLSQQRDYLAFWAIMVTFGSGGAYGCNVARMLSGKRKIPVILTLQEGDSENHLRYSRGGLISLSWRLALKCTDFLTAISTFLLHRGELFGYRGRSALVPNGVDVQLFSRQFSPEEKEVTARKLGKKPGEVFLVTVSRLTHKNAIDDIIRSLVRLPERVSLLIIGKGEEGPALQALARELDVASRVKFIGFVPNESIPLYFSICDIFVRPSRSEGFGNSFIEAMAARLPVIATPVGGIPDFLDDKETGLFCSPDNPQSIAEAVTLLLGDAALADHVSDRAFQRVSERYDWSTISREMKEKVFDTI